MFEIAAAGALQRMIEVALRAAPTIMVGLLVAAVFRHLLGKEGTLKLFSGKHGLGLLKAWLVGMLLPVCSLGVLPVVREMRRARVGAGATIAFALTAPLFNPISVLYGLTMSDPVVLLSFCFGSLTIVTVLGVVWEKLMPSAAEGSAAEGSAAEGSAAEGSAAEASSTTDATSTASSEVPNLESELPPIPYGWRRIVGMGALSARESVGPMLGYAIVTLLGIGLITALLPHGALMSRAEADDPWAPAFMALVSIPVYAAPMSVMMQLASMFQHGNSIGAAFSLLVLGAGLNLGLVIWLLRNHPTGRTLIALVSLWVLVVGIAYAFDKPLYDKGVEPAGHTHAFDGYCNPFMEGHPDPWNQVWRNLADTIQFYEIAGSILLAVVLLVGTVLVLVDPKRRLERWLTKVPQTQRANWDVALPEWVLGLVTLVGLVLASLFGCYLYYPPRETVLAEMRMVHAEVFSAANSGDWDTALYWIPIYDDWARKLIVGEYLRGNRVSDYQRAKTKVLLEQLERLEHEAEDQELAESQNRVRRLNTSFTRFRAVFKSPEPEATSG